MRELVTEISLFLIKQIRSLIFPAIFFTLLIASHSVPDIVTRYDFLFLGCVIAQLLLLWLGIETRDEVKVIAVFHIIGLVLELFKTQPRIGSWSYPEDSLFRISTVPLYSGFMYATVASYLCQAWRFFHVELKDYPRYVWSLPLCALIYVNFFTHHFIMDFRWVLTALVLVVFWSTKVQFRVHRRQRRISLIACYFIAGAALWVAENVSTFYGAWVYPNQAKGWKLVGYGKISSWMLLIILSFIIVADLKFVKARLSKASKTEEDVAIDKTRPVQCVTEPK